MRMIIHFFFLLRQMRGIIQFFFLLRQMQLWWLGRLGILCQRKSAEDQKGDYSGDGDYDDGEGNGDDDEQIKGSEMKEGGSN